MTQAQTVPVVALLWLLVGGASISSADTGFATRAAPLVQKFCTDCHGGDLAEAGINLQQLAASPDFGSQFKTWEKVLDMLRQRKMPPADMPQPTDAQRQALVNAIQRELDRFIEAHAGDPGPVVMRRLTAAEYDWTIQDLTGLDLPLERSFEDAVGGEGFANVGQVQFMQDSTLERYLEAARTVAAHAVIGSGPLDFFADPGQTGLELSAIRRIQQIYERHGFRTGAGEGAVPFGLDMYPRAFYVAWQHRHRAALGRRDASLASLAEAEGLSVRFAEYIWQVLQEPAASFPTSAISERWQALPEPGGDRQQLDERVRAGCEDVYRQMRDWQRLLAAATGDEEEAAVLTGDGLNVSPRHSFEADLDWSEGAATATLELSVTPASNDSTNRSIVVFRNPRIRFRTERRRWSDERPLKSVLARHSRERLEFGRSPQGAELDARDFALSSPAQVSIALDVPESATRAELLVDVELDLRAGGGLPVRCTVSDGVIEGETAAESGGYSALLADPDTASYAAWEQGVLAFARKLPEVSHREPAPSDRDPIPAAFDNTYNGTERNLFHTRIKYHRDDEFLVTHILDDAARKRLDQAWTDLLSSFEYHDLCLRFVADKSGVNLHEDGIAGLDRDQIARLPDEPRPFVERLAETYVAGQERLAAAQPGHIDDALRFAEQAWRRPLTELEQTRLRSFYLDLRQDAGLDHTAAVRALLTRILVAPAFLYRVEPPAEERGIVPLSDWELASRLSYFLWSSVPDSELRDAAAAGRLNDPDELARQARRMLRDPKARRFATEFFGQWFGFYRFDTYQGIDATRFPEFSNSLKAAMYDEAVSFFEHIVREDRPVGEILFADYTFLNRPLAEHYGIGAEGIGPQPVDPETIPADRPVLVAGVKPHHRGGLLRLGAVLTVTSAPLRTSPVKRGDWILRRVLGTPVPPPPPDAGSIPADDVLADRRTVRERLEAHRRDASCINCHSRMDPLGFALEHFDTIGRWRDQYRDGAAIDAAGTLHDGTTISGPDGLHEYLQNHERQFQRTLCSKLLGYALGRSEIASDRPLIEQMLSSLGQDAGISGLVVQVVTSRQFRHQRGTPAETAAAKQD